MPRFTSTKGIGVFIPARTILFAESPAGLSTTITFAMPQGQGQVEVEGTMESVGRAIEAELLAVR